MGREHPVRDAFLKGVIVAGVLTGIESQNSDLRFWLNDKLNVTAEFFARDLNFDVGAAFTWALMDANNKIGDTIQSVTGQPMDDQSRLQRNYVSPAVNSGEIVNGLPQGVIDQLNYWGDRYGKFKNLSVARIQELKAIVAAIKETETCDSILTPDLTGNICSGGQGPQVTNGVNSSHAGGTYQFLKATYENLISRMLADGVITDADVNGKTWSDLDLGLQTIATMYMADGKGMTLSNYSGFIDAFTKPNNNFTVWNQSDSQAQSVFNIATSMKKRF